MQKLLRDYILLALEARQVRVPTQLVDIEEETEENIPHTNGDEPSIDEFSGVGAVAGYVLPLGASSEDYNGKTVKKKG
jgi:hypothetical protein